MFETAAVLAGGALVCTGGPVATSPDMLLAFTGNKAGESLDLLATASVGGGYVVMVLMGSTCGWSEVTG